MNPLVKMLLDALVRYLQANPTQVDKLIEFIIGEIAKQNG
jgi:hypothetical protein